MRTAIAFLLLTSTTFAADIEHPTIRLRNGIEAYEAAVTSRTPARVAKMTAREYFNFANARNLMALRANRQARFAPSNHVRYATINESAGASQTRFGGGVGAGGFGGSGGYAGYLGAADQQSGYGAGYGYGSGRPGNSVQSKGSSYSKSYTLEYHDWPTFNGGDVELLNPYFRPR